MIGEAAALLIASLVAGGVASITGFGIGSILTPTLTLWMDARLAVALVSIPHLVGTCVRFAMVKGHVDRRVLWRFGLASAAGGLAGALLQARWGGAWLMTLLAVLLLFVAVGEFSGLSRRWRFSGPAAWFAGIVSGLLGGLVGNQGGIRSAALLGFGLPRDAFVATATAIALFVDGARMPVYLATERHALLHEQRAIVITIAGVVAGTLIGSQILTAIPEARFRKGVAVMLAALGVALLLRAC